MQTPIITSTITRRSSICGTNGHNLVSISAASWNLSSELTALSETVAAEVTPFVGIDLCSLCRSCTSSSAATCWERLHHESVFLPVWQASLQKRICCWSMPFVDRTRWTPLPPSMRKQPSCCWCYPASPCCSAACRQPDLRTGAGAVVLHLHSIISAKSMEAGIKIEAITLIRQWVLLLSLGIITPTAHPLQRDYWG